MWEDRISRNEQRMQKELGERYWMKSAPGIIFRNRLPPILEKHSTGDLLDAGAGNLLFKELLEDYCEDYRSLDIDGEKMDFQQDIQDMEGVDAESFDTVFCRNVLEHVENPQKAVAEIERVLRPGGKAIVSVPHLAYLHNEPDDYYRFTRYGLKELCSETDMEMILSEEFGGFFSFLGYIWSTILLGLIYDRRVLFELLFYLNYLFQSAAVKIDEVTGNSRYLPLNYIAVFEKQD